MWRHRALPRPPCTAPHSTTPLHEWPHNPHRPPAVRGATLFGQGLLQNAYINVQSANQRSGFPVSLAGWVSRVKWVGVQAGGGSSYMGSNSPPASLS